MPAKKKSVKKSSTKKKTVKKKSTKKENTTTKTTKKKHNKAIKRQVTKRTKLQRVKKPLIIISIIIIILLGLLGFANFKVKLLFDNEASIAITPSVASTTVVNGQEAQLDFFVTIERLGLCTFNCQRTVHDLSTGKVAQKQNVSYKDFSETITFPIPLTGEGQNIFNYDIKCTALEGRFCPVEEKEYSATAFVTINRELNTAQEMLQTEQEQRLSKYIAKLAQVEGDITHIKKIYEALEKISDDEILEKKVEEQEFYLEVLQENTISILEEWKRQAFEKVKIPLAKAEGNIEQVNKTSKALLEELDAIQEDYNTAVQLITQIHNSNVRKDAWLLEGSKERNLISANKSYTQLVNESIPLDFMLPKIIQLYELHTTVQEDIGIEKEAMQTTQEKVYASMEKDVKNALNKTISITNCSSLAEANELLTNYTIVNASTNQIALRKVLDFYCIEHKNKTVFTMAPPQKIIIEKKEVSPREIPTPKAQCCYKSSCYDCGEQEKTPIVLVHGHSFMQSHSPELAFTRLNFLQEKLTQDGYINAGRIGAGFAEDTIPVGDWGQNKLPVVVSMTYYYINTYHIGELQVVTRKTDNIENYAIRLKESVDLVRQKTGSDEVILIAHSMGGLVSREYLRLFGDDKVKALIILGTPNHGVEGDVKKYCTVTGAKSECEDMYVDSIFLRKLNAPGSEPTHTKVYTVTALGCEMKSDVSKSEAGDGVVLARSVALDFAPNYNITGECTDTLSTNLHMNFVNPNLYPKTYEIINNILKEIEEN